MDQTVRISLGHIDLCVLTRVLNILTFDPAQIYTLVSYRTCLETPTSNGYAPHSK